MYDRDIEETRKMTQRGHMPEKTLIPCTKSDGIQHGEDQGDDMGGAAMSQTSDDMQVPRVQARGEWMERATEIPDMANQNQ
eukprot:1389295-Pyramimonas_sp.AAC.1